MKITFQRKVDRWAGTFICRILSFFSLKKKGDVNKIKPRKILIILLSEMGSLIFAYPMFKRIWEKFPDASLYVLLVEKNREALELIKVIPRENIMTICDKSLLSFISDSLSVLRRMRKIQFDVVIDCELFARVSSIFSFFSGARISVGFDRYTQEGLYRGDFINRPILYNPYHHIAHQFLTMVESIDSETVPMNKYLSNTKKLEAPHVEFGLETLQKMKSKLYHDYPAIINKNLVLLYPSGGILPVRAWPIHYYCQLSSDLIKGDYAVGVIGLKEDKDLANTILSHCKNPSCIDLTGYTKTIRELIMILCLSSLLITNDGGPAQLSALSRTPAIVLYGPETPTLYGTLNEKAIHLFASLSCSPCVTAYNHRNSPCDGDNRCLKYLTPEQVFDEAKKILKSQ